MSNWFYVCVEVGERQRIMWLSFTAATEGFDPVRRKNIDRREKNKYTKFQYIVTFHEEETP